MHSCVTKDVLAYVDYLKDGTMYRNSINDAFDGKINEKNWKHSAEHMFEIGIGMNTQGRSSLKNKNRHVVILERQKHGMRTNNHWYACGGQNGTFRIDESNLGRARQRMAIKTLVVGCFFII